MATTKCAKCGTENMASSWRCRNCSSILRVSTDQSKKAGPTILQPQEPILTRVKEDPPAYAQPFANSRNDGDIPDAIEVEIAGNPGNSRMLLWGGIGAALLVAAAMAFFFIGKSGPEIPTPSEAFANAEKLVASGNFLAAREAFSNFVSNYPESDLVALAKNRLATISDSLSSQENKKSREVEDLLTRAEEAFREKRFVFPDENNAVEAIQQVLALDPENTTALGIQDKIVRYYHSEADKAVKAKRYAKAMDLYERVLTFLPEHSETQNNIQLLKRRMK